VIIGSMVTGSLYFPSVCSSIGCVLQCVQPGSFTLFQGGRGSALSVPCVNAFLFGPRTHSSPCGWLLPVTNQCPTDLVYFFKHLCADRKPAPVWTSNSAFHVCIDTRYRYHCDDLESSCGPELVRYPNIKPLIDTKTSQI
jgi:hypothetical protein